MKPINSRERNRLLRQFVFLFFAMAVLPVALIFLAYYRLPEVLSYAEQRKLMQYADFARAQQLLTLQLAGLDSNLSAFAEGNTSEDPDLIKQRIVSGIDRLNQADTSRLISLITKAYSAHLSHLVRWQAARNAQSETAEELSRVTEALDACRQEQAGLARQTLLQPAP